MTLSKWIVGVCQLRLIIVVSPFHVNMYYDFMIAPVLCCTIFVIMCVLFLFFIQHTNINYNITYKRIYSE